MTEVINDESYKTIDEERIKKALDEGNYNDAFVLFNYSSLTKEEFKKLHQQYVNIDVLENQTTYYIIQKDKERIEKAFLDRKYEVAEYIFQTSEITDKEFNEIKASFSVPDKNDYVRNPKMVLEITPENECWTQILHIISDKISKPSFDTWFKGTKGIIVENKITVICNNEFQRDWLEERYRELILATAEEVLGIECKIIFQVQ
ncbi:DnaA N-terminal domain-containing protein [Robertmurraya sp. Marseille-Q9965]